MKLNYVQHRDDEGLDEVQVIVDEKPLLRCIMVPRYKTSELSGDEWRVSAMWERREGGIWTPFDGGYCSIETACAAIYPGVWSDHKDLHDLPCDGLRFRRKGRHIIDMTNNGERQQLLATLGHLPWALRIWPEQYTGHVGWFRGDATPDLCFQVGCSEPAVSTYLLNHRYDSEGNKHTAENDWSGRDARRFCAKHLRRGDCGLDDSDRNYTVHEGQGPDGHKTDLQDISPSRLVLVEEKP
jgi:hypothetical protein